MSAFRISALTSPTTAFLGPALNIALPCIGYAFDRAAIAFTRVPAVYLPANVSVIVSMGGNTRSEIQLNSPIKRPQIAVDGRRHARVVLVLERNGESEELRHHSDEPRVDLRLPG